MSLKFMQQSFYIFSGKTAVSFSYTLGSTDDMFHSSIRLVCAPRFVSSQQRFGVTDIKAPLGVPQLSGLGQTMLQLAGLKQTVLQLLDKSVLQLSVTALFYLDNSKKIHPRGVRACRPKDAKRRVPQHGGEREREPFGSFFYMFFLPPGPALCKLGLARSAVLPEVLMQVLRPSFDLSLFYFCRILPSLSFVCVSRSVVSNSLRPHGLQPTRLLCPWDSPGKNTEVGCPFSHHQFGLLFSILTT